jgi:hypothetical protein
MSTTTIIKSTGIQKHPGLGFELGVVVITPRAEDLLAKLMIKTGQDPTGYLVIHRDRIACWK